jgi:hypothetical protein
MKVSPQDHGRQPARVMPIMNFGRANRKALRKGASMPPLDAGAMAKVREMPDPLACAVGHLAVGQLFNLQAYSANTSVFAN